MFALKPYSETEAFPFKVTFTDKFGDTNIKLVVSYIEDPAVIALLTKGLVKYDFTIEALPAVLPGMLTLNQYVGQLRRLYSYTKKKVTREKVITYTETVIEID